MSDTKQERQQNGGIDGVWSDIAVGNQHQANDGGQARERRMLMKEPAKIRRNAVDLHRVQPSRRLHEIGDVVIERRNRETAELFRQSQAEECGDRGKSQGEANNGGDPASLMRQFSAGSNQKIKPRRGKRIFMNDSIHDDLNSIPKRDLPREISRPAGVASTLPVRNWDEKERCYTLTNPQILG
jgi:hypothetical protein